MTEPFVTEIRAHLETNLLELLSLEDVPSVKDERRLVHGRVDGRPVEVNEGLPFCESLQETDSQLGDLAYVYSRSPRTSNHDNG